jgi:flavin reductase (DIM6/NTAB) family NADH-FMN oxidoreductase RutF
MLETTPIKPFNSLLHPYNTALVTCCDAQGKPNIITIAWLIPVSISPQLLAMAVRPERYSYGLIHESVEFVVNMAGYDIAQQALYCGRYSGKVVDKFAATGLTPAPAQLVRPPVIQECHTHLECRLVDEVKAGDHTLMIGEVLAAYARKGVTLEGGVYDLSQVQPLMHVGKNFFTTTQAEVIEPEV